MQRIVTTYVALYRDRCLGFVEAEEHAMSSCEWFPMSHQQIRAWLDRHPDALPLTLDDLNRFPMAFRRVMINAVAPDIRLRLWREHLETFLGPGSTLTAPQRRLVAATIPRLPELFALRPPSPAMTEWEREVRTVFSRQEAVQVFMSIGRPEPPEGIPLPPDALPAPAV